MRAMINMTPIQTVFILHGKGAAPREAPNKSRRALRISSPNCEDFSTDRGCYTRIPQSWPKTPLQIYGAGISLHIRW
jgi:hypothetical protein